MRRTELLQEIRMMRFEEAYYGWQEQRLTQQEAARLLGVCDRTFRRYINRYEEEGLEGLYDKRIAQASHRRAPVDEVMKVTDLYKSRYSEFNVKHFYSWYRRLHGGGRSYTWVKNTLQAQGVVKKAPKRGAHRKKRPRSPYAGMMIHQDGSLTGLWRSWRIGKRSQRKRGQPVNGLPPYSEMTAILMSISKQNPPIFTVTMFDSNAR